LAERGVRVAKLSKTQGQKRVRPDVRHELLDDLVKSLDEVRHHVVE